MSAKKTKRSIDLGCGGFLRLRRKVADLCGEEVSAHYRLMLDSLYDSFDTTEGKQAFWEDYDQKTVRLVQSGKLNIKIADFLYETDLGGQATYGTCKNLLKVIGDYDDNILYGYAGRPDCARFRDFKAILEDCVRTKSALVWY